MDPTCGAGVEVVKEVGEEVEVEIEAAVVEAPTSPPPTMTTSYWFL